MKTYTVTVEDSDGNTAVYSEIEEKDFSLNLTNDLDKLPNILGSLHPTPWYSKGFSFTIQGYVKNPNEEEEYKKAIDEMSKVLD